MTRTLSLRLDEDRLAEIDRRSALAGIDRSTLIREALDSHLARLAATDDADAYDAEPITDDELAFVDAQAWDVAKERPATGWATDAPG